ncbi:Spy/CpxP family protein refolding chaperone [Swingsia samuiensis]|uniref:Periplasmic heavy metal sensor n=1 Tax=Swingsia samuiensis TaxID=1293412 RepID=A0A4Y6UFJ1_9PROT|nr:Spy/CpxP family protein refolding chaperone [Swingsia samuiensis]QDH16309.1 hypothetical protein E3D00_01010 [Swingsia samuiensis]
MRLSTRSVFLSAMLVLGMGASVSDARACSMGGGEMMMGHPFPPLPASVKLNEQQKAELHGVLHLAHEQSQIVHEKLRTVREKMNAALYADGELDHASLNELLHQEAVLYEQEARSRLEVQEKIHDILTPEQRKQAIEAMRKVKELHKQIDALIAPPSASEPPGAL